MKKIGRIFDRLGTLSFFAIVTAAGFAWMRSGSDEFAKPLAQMTINGIIGQGFKNFEAGLVILAGVCGFWHFLWKPFK